MWEAYKGAIGAFGNIILSTAVCSVTRKTLLQVSMHSLCFPQLLKMCHFVSDRFTFLTLLTTLHQL